MCPDPSDFMASPPDAPSACSIFPALPPGLPATSFLSFGSYPEGHISPEGFMDPPICASSSITFFFAQHSLLCELSKRLVIACLPHWNISSIFTFPFIHCYIIRVFNSAWYIVRTQEIFIGICLMNGYNKNPMLFITVYHFPGLAEAISRASHQNSWLENHLVCVVPSIFLNLYYNPKT